VFDLHQFVEFSGKFMAQLKASVCDEESGICSFLACVTGGSIGRAGSSRQKMRLFTRYVAVRLWMYDRIVALHILIVLA
jgi:hypothetical protein